MKITVHYRDRREPDFFRDAAILLEADGAVGIREKTTSYGGSRCTYIPWDLVQEIITEA